MCDIIDLGKLLSQKKNEEKNKAQGDATLPEFLQGGVDEEPFFLVNKETGKRARLVDLFEIEEVEEAVILDFNKPED
jgi:hypothetical protein